MIGDVFLVGTALIYNLATLGLLFICLRSMNLKLMLREKAVPVAAVPANPVGPTAPGPGRGGDPDGGNSYSRITGCAGSVVLATFIWALGNAVLYNAYEAPQTVKDMLTGVAPFILSGSALFAPYAFNQLSSALVTKL